LSTVKGENEIETTYSVTAIQQHPINERIFSDRKKKFIRSVDYRISTTIRNQVRVENREHENYQTVQTDTLTLNGGWEGLCMQPTSPQASTLRR
jgi:hypothetical protein